MTPEAQRIAIAEWCGWKRETSESLILQIRKTQWTKGGTEGYPPDYLNDLNAMHEAEKCLTGRQWTDYVIRLEKRGGPFPSQINVSCVVSFYLAHATAAQRAEALLRTIGKWVE